MRRLLDSITTDVLVKIWLLLIVIFIILYITSCSVRKTSAPVPGCPGAFIAVPEGCQKRDVPNGVDVYCINGSLHHFKCMGQTK